MRKLLAGLAIGIGAAALVWLIAWPGWLDVAELKTYDWRMRTLRERTSRASQDIVLVEINDATIRELQEIAGRWPWPRAISALLIDYLHRGAPKAIAVDIGFWEREREASYPLMGEDYTAERSDRDLAEAVKRAGTSSCSRTRSIPAWSTGRCRRSPGTRRRIVSARRPNHGR